MKVLLFTLLCMVASCYGQLSGDVISSVEDADITVALMNLLNAYSNDKEVAVGMANMGTSSFVNPKIFIAGCCNQLHPVTITTGQTGLVLFGSNVFTGPEGVICYDLTETAHMVCISYRVPGADGIHQETFNVKIYPSTVPVDWDLVNHMNDESGGAWNPNTVSLRTRNEYGITVDVSMTTGDSVTLIVKVDSTDYTTTVGPDLAYGCINKRFDGNYCWRECHAIPPLGYCWLPQVCTTSEDCVAFLDPDVQACDGECVGDGIAAKYAFDDIFKNVK